jgi:hypothetical protein
MTADDAEARKRRAEALRRRRSELAGDEQTERPPESPLEFIEREMAERAREEREKQARKKSQETPPTEEEDER